MGVGWGLGGVTRAWVRVWRGRGRGARMGMVLLRDCGRNGVRLTIIPDYAIVYLRLGEEANQTCGTSQ